MTPTQSRTSYGSAECGQTSRQRETGNPVCFSPHLYREGNHVERSCNSIKHCRRIATRYDKLAKNFPTFIKPAAIRLWLRVYASTT